MRQKVLICGALLHDPELLVFDEPLAGLDVTTALVLRDLVSTLARRGKIILYSSHVLETVEKICSRVIILKQGRVAADGHVTQLRDLMPDRRSDGACPAAESTWNILPPECAQHGSRVLYSQ